ncbi:MAG: DNA-binding response regulator [Chromatiaceae bacterium]|jgi:DNA-binding NarL/FixJ family response regulator|nr:MAG: DNA-binding response regulator [Chromatiaceae bacterium]
MIKVILADDHRMVRDGLGMILAREPDIEVCAYACDGADAITLAQAWKPDVVLMDVCMPGINGIEATLRIRKLLPRTRVVALSAQGERPFVMQMVEAGATGFVLKDQSVEILARAIRAVAAGDTWLPEVAVTSKRAEKRLLSRRESAVLGELATGKRAREVAESMGISSKTVDTYRRRIMSKLGLSSQAELLRYAVALHAGRSALPPVQVAATAGGGTAAAS